MEAQAHFNACPSSTPVRKAGGPRTRVLVVDDERGPRESLRMILSGRHDVVVAEDGPSALDCLRTEAIDLVTVDLNMPGMKGVELMRSIRAEFPQVEIIVITGCGSIESAVEGIRHGVFDYLTKPFDVVQVAASVERALDRRASRARMIDFLEELGRVLGLNRSADQVLQELEVSGLAQERLRALLAEPVLGLEAGSTRVGGPRAAEFLEILAETIESRDVFMRGHARRVAFFSDLVSDRLCLAQKERDEIRLAAFLHDIGKVGAPSDLLAGATMPEPDRMEAITDHPAIAERLLKPLGLTTAVSTIVRHHHERFDGAGYPDGIAGEDIPLGARIIAIVDAYDAMTCERPYRRARSREEALEELRREAGGQFDANLVNILCELISLGATDSLGDTWLLDVPGIVGDGGDALSDRGAA